MVDASQFASTPAGYISSIVVPVVLLMITGTAGWLGKRALARIDNKFESLEQHDEQFEDSMQKTTQALAVIVERIAPMQEQINSNSKDAQSLKEATAVLKATLDRHERWHERQPSG